MAKCPGHCGIHIRVRGRQKELQAPDFAEADLGHGNRERMVELFSTSKKVPSPLFCKKLNGFGSSMKGAQEPGGQNNVASSVGKARAENGKNSRNNFNRNWVDVNSIIQIKKISTHRPLPQICGMATGSDQLDFSSTSTFGLCRSVSQRH